MGDAWEPDYALEAARDALSKLKELEERVKALESEVHKLKETKPPIIRARRRGK